MNLPLPALIVLGFGIILGCPPLSTRWQRGTISLGMLGILLATITLVSSPHHPASAGTTSVDAAALGAVWGTDGLAKWTQQAGLLLGLLGLVGQLGEPLVRGRQWLSSSQTLLLSGTLMLLGCAQDLLTLGLAWEVFRAVRVTARGASVTHSARTVSIGSSILLWLGIGGLLAWTGETRLDRLSTVLQSIYSPPEPFIPLGDLSYWGRASCLLVLLGLAAPLGLVPWIFPFAVLLPDDRCVGSTTDDSTAREPQPSPRGHAEVGRRDEGSRTELDSATGTELVIEETGNAVSVTTHSAAAIDGMQNLPEEPVAWQQMLVGIGCQIGAATALARCLMALGPVAETLSMVLLVLSALTCAVSASLAVTAVRVRDELTHLLRFQAGWIGIGLAAVSREAGQPLQTLAIFPGYPSAVAGLLSSITLQGVGLIAIVIAQRAVADLSAAYEYHDGWSGLSRRSPLTAACLLVALLNVSGLPPFPTFWGRSLLLLGLLNSRIVGGEDLWIATATPIVCGGLASLTSVLLFRVVLRWLPILYPAQVWGQPRPTGIGVWQLATWTGLAVNGLLTLMPQVSWEGIRAIPMSRPAAPARKQPGGGDDPRPRLSLAIRDSGDQPRISDERTAQHLRRATRKAALGWPPANSTPHPSDADCGIADVADRAHC